MTLTNNWSNKAVQSSREQKRQWGLALMRIGLVALLLVWPSASAHGQCIPPRYRIGRVWEDSNTAVTMYISIRESDFAPQRLVCLAEALKQRYANRDLMFFLFSDHYAAKHLPVPIELSTESSAGIAKLTARRHAEYIKDNGRHEDYLLILPDGLRLESPFNTRIDLPVSAIPQCSLQVKGRCLLVLPYVELPWYSLEDKLTGTVSLTATVARDGRIEGNQLAQASVNQREYETALIKVAIKNLKGWRFEYARHEDTLRVTYSHYVNISTDQSPVIRTPHLDVEIESPGKSPIAVNLTIVGSR